jgi:hypothetical protein
MPCCRAEDPCSGAIRSFHPPYFRNHHYFTSRYKHVKGRDLGYNPDNLIMIPTSAATQKNFDVIKEELLKTGQVKAVTRSLSPITAIWWSSPAPDWDGKPADAQIIVTGNSVDADFTKPWALKCWREKTLRVCLPTHRL